MPNYEYTAIDRKGKKAKGTLTAESPYAARKQLRLRGIHPATIQEVTATAERTGQVFAFLHGTKKRDIVDFSKQLATMLLSGIKLTEALSILTLQTNNVRLRNILVEIRDRVITGESLAETLRDYPAQFDVIYVSMVRVGEMTGNLAGSLSTIAAFMEKRQRVESKIVTAMIYPICLICFATIVVVVLTVKVIPPIAAQIEKTGQTLPWITRFLVQVGNLLTSAWILVILALLAALVLGLRQFFRSERGATLRDRTLLALPLFGPLLRQSVVSRFAATLSTLLRSGLPMAESLRVVAEVTGNIVMKRAVQSARERILSGADITTPLRDSGVISPAIAHMVGVGEKSGELEKMLQNVSDDLEDSTDMVVERLSAAVEPVIIILIAGVVGVIAYATVLPMLKLSTTF